MARFEMTEVAFATLGEAPAVPTRSSRSGMMYASGRYVPTDLVSAHKWFNLAAMSGNPDAARLRREIAEQMSDGEIARGATGRARLAQVELNGLPKCGLVSKVPCRTRRHK